MIKIMILYM